MYKIGDYVVYKRDVCKVADYKKIILGVKIIILLFQFLMKLLK